MDSFRELHDQVTRFTGESLFEEVLKPAIPDCVEMMQPLESLRSLEESPPGQVPVECLWSLFALNTVRDALILPLQVSLHEYRGFFSALGFEVIPDQEPFDPLIHEIVEVGNWTKESEGVRTGCQYWPGLRYGELVFARSAVDVYCAPELGIVEGVADKSVLYFTHQRVRRDCRDLSHGWGHNSMWRTAHARNYRVGDYTFFNVDGKHDLAWRPKNPVLEGLSLMDAREVLMNQCCVRSILADDDLFPYDWRLTLSGSACRWPIADYLAVPTEGAMDELGITGAFWDD